LSQFGYDASRSAVVVRFDATLLGEDGAVRQQRFEAVEEGVLAEAGDVGAALNRAANEVARQVADWVE
jgi:cholesterol transport system auxiliary component